MNMERLIGWLQIIGNLGILGGLILVALQLNQTADIARVDFSYRLNELNNSQSAVIMGEDVANSWAKASFAPETLTGEDLVVIWAVLDYRHDLQDSLWALDPSPGTQSVIRWHAHNYYGANPAARAWWKMKHPELEQSSTGESDGWYWIVGDELKRDGKSEVVRMAENLCRELASSTFCHHHKDIVLGNNNSD